MITLEAIRADLYALRDQIDIEKHLPKRYKITEDRRKYIPDGRDFHWKFLAPPPISCIYEELFSEEEALRLLHHLFINAEFLADERTDIAG